MTNKGLTLPFPTLPIEWLPLRDVLQRIPMSREQWREGVVSGLYPKPISINHCYYWSAADVAASIKKMLTGVQF